MKQVYFIRFFLILALTVIGSQSWSQYQMENLDRGVVATSMGGTKVFISWRWLGTEPDNITFNLYRGTTKLNSTPLTVSNYTDNSGSTSASYTVRPVINGVEQAASNPVTPWAQQFLKVPVQTPAGGTTPDGVAYTYNANDASVADLDGDGKYEIILKWDPSNSKDNSQSGYTGNTYVDAYKLDGTRLWRIDFGINIRSGAHYMDFMVYDFDGDGKAEMMCRTADGTKDAAGTIIGTANADYRNSSGYVLSGPEYISVFNGLTGTVMATSNYIPARGTVSSWGDSYGNRVDRFRAGVAYVDGQRPTGIFCRGYYTRAVVAAWDWRGGKLTNRWTFDSNNSGNSSYAGQGDHSLSIADVDNDGKQEVIVGSAIIDDNGSGYYNTTFGHGDALHVSDLDPDLPGLEVFNIQERLDVEGAYMYSATNKKVLWTKPTLLDGSQTEGPGRGVCGDITSAYRGAESWVAGGGISGTWDCKGNQFSTSVPASCNFLIWWDGDLLRELLNNTMIDKYGTGRILTAYNIAPIASNNGTKSTPCLSGDIIGDWREEVIWRGSANDALYIFTTNTPSTYKFRTFMHEPQYRVAIAWQNTGYNQPPHVGFYLGDGMTTPPTPNIVIVGQNTTNTPPSVNLTAPANNASYCSGTAITLTANATDANGTISKVEFYDGTTLLSTGTVSPYTFNWTNAGTGTHVLTAKATDSDNAVTTSSSVSITINALPSTPVVSTPVSYCQNAAASALTAIGTGLKWYAVASGGTASTTAPTPVTTSTGTTNYYVSQTTNNCESARAIIAVTVNSLPTAPVVTTPVTYCQNTVASALTANGTALKWYTVASGGTATTTAPTPVTTSTGATNYYVSQTTNNCESARAIIAVTVNSLPTAPIVTTPVTYCQNTVASALTATGTALKWYTVASGGTASTIAPTPVTTSTGTINYYVSQTTNNCESARAIIAVTVNSLPTAPIVTTPVTYCQNAVASALTATGTVLKWYTVASGGTASTTAPTPVTTSTGTTNYYVSQTTNNCESGRALIAVIVDAIPSAPIVTSPVTYCQNVAAPALNATGTGLMWYTVASGGTASTTAPTPVTTSTGTTNYYVSQTTNNCESARAMISVTVNALPSAPGVTSPVTYCQNAVSSVLTATGSALKWYTIASGGAGSATAPTPVTSVAGTTNYYVSQTLNNCESARAMISISVNASTVIVPYVQINGTWQQQNFGQVCEGNSIVLGPQPITSTGWSWTGPNNFSASTREITFTNINTSQGGTYIATFLDGNGCLSTSNINISVGPLPSSPTVNSQISYCQNATATPLTAVGTSLKWYSIAVGGSGTASAPLPVTSSIGTTNYYVSQTINNCESARAMIAVTTNSLPSAVISPSGPINFVQGGSVTLTSSIGSSYIWFNGTTPVGTDMSYTATSTGNYSVEVTNASGCKNTSDQVIVTVNPDLPPAVNITLPVNNAVYTAPANITLTAVATDADGSISKVDFYNGSILIGTDPTSPYNFALNNLIEGTYSVTAVATDNSGLSTTSAPVIFTVNPPPNQLPQVSITSPLDGSTYVENAIVVIEATASDVDGNITQVEFFNGNSFLSTDNSFPYSFTWSPVSAGTYNITARATDNKGGVSTSSIVSITVNGNQPSIITITSPVANSNITSNSITINVTATDPDGAITLVEFYDGTTLIGSTTNQPYIFTWENPSVGTHVISVKVTDSNGGITTSSSTFITVSTQTAILKGKSKDAYCKIFPNPTNNVVQIETGVNLESATFVFLDLFGSEINLPIFIYDQNAKLDVSLVPSGVYFLTIRKDDFVVSEKIIVIH